MTEENTLKAGDTVVVTTGVYDDYCVDNVILVKRDIDIDAEFWEYKKEAHEKAGFAAGFRKANREDFVDGWDLSFAEGFLDRLKSSGSIEVLPFHLLHLGDEPSAEVYCSFYQATRGDEDNE